MTSAGPPTELRSERVEVPAFDFPEDAARAVALAARHGRWRARGEGTIREPTHARPDQAAAIISDELGRGGGWLSPATDDRPARLLRAAARRDARRHQCRGGGRRGRRAWDRRRAQGERPRTRRQERVPEPSSSASPIAAAILAAAAEIQATSVERVIRPDELIVQKMSTGGIELIVGMVHDPNFGPVLACGPGARTTGDDRRTSPSGSHLSPTSTSTRCCGRCNRSRCSRVAHDGPHHDVAAVEQLLMGVSATGRRPSRDRRARPKSRRGQPGWRIDRGRPGTR